MAVPPFELSTAAVFSEWDRLGGPTGRQIPSHRLPPALRDEAPLVNDLYGAAVSLAPDLDGWKSELEQRWATPVAMSGSGSTLFAMFVDRDEAVSALDAVPSGARATHAAMPVPIGWVIDDDGAIVTPPPRRGLLAAGPDLREWAERLLAAPLA